MKKTRRVRIGDIAEVFDGPHATPKVVDVGPVFLGIRNITPDGLLDFSVADCVSEDDFARWTRRVTPIEDDIVFSYEATLHRYAMIPRGFRGCLGRRIALVRVDKSKASPRFVYYTFRTAKWRSYIENNLLYGATVNRVPIAKFPDFEIDLPPLEVQFQIMSELAKIDEQIELHRRSVELLKESRDLIFPLMISSMPDMSKI